MKATTTLAEKVTAEGRRMVLLEHDGNYYLRVDGVPLMSTTATASEERLGELAGEILKGRSGGRVLIGGLGFGFTLKRVLETVPATTEVVVAELLPEMVEWNREFLRACNGGCLEDPRVKVEVGDVADLLAKVEGGYDVILMDVDNGPEGLVARRNDTLYGRQGLERVKGALKERGVAVFWSAHRDPGFVELLGRAGFAVEELACKAYPQAKKPTHTLFLARRRRGVPSRRPQ